MRPIRTTRTIATVLLLASLALTGCRASQADQSATPGTKPPATTAAPATKAPASTTPATTAPSPKPSTTNLDLPPGGGHRVMRPWSIVAGS
jgi:glucose/arabinose dehydrogenase